MFEKTPGKRTAGIVALVYTGASIEIAIRRSCLAEERRNCHPLRQIQQQFLSKLSKALDSTGLSDCENCALELLYTAKRPSRCARRDTRHASLQEPDTDHGSNFRDVSPLVNCNNICARKLLPCVLNLLHLDLLLRVVQIVRKQPERTVSKEQVDFLQCELLRFL
jgi:hypothetical protein